MIHRLERSQWVSLDRPRVFEFFSDPTNLERITPPSMRFRIESTPLPVLCEGAIIDYRIRLMGLPLKWRSLISQWQPPVRFVDEQLQGPYRSWRHTHTLVASGGGTTIEDVVLYELPLPPFGDLAHRLVVRQLAAIFAFRQQAIEQIFAKSHSSGVA